MADHGVSDAVCGSDVTDDGTDGVLMLGAYNWAFVNPMRKLYYNFVLTGVSVAVAVLIGGIQAFGLAANSGIASARLTAISMGSASPSLACLSSPGLFP